MFHLFRLFIVTLTLWYATGPVFSDDPLSIAPQEGALLLRNGNVLQGTIVRSGDRYYVSIRGGQLVVKAGEVRFLCRDLNEAYLRQQKGVVEDQIGDRLKLAQWCLRNRLFDEAADELVAAKSIDADNRRLAMLERQLKFARRKPLRKATPVLTETVPSPDELARLIRGMPSGTVHEFAKSIQPLLINGCSTSHCHTERSTSKFKLLRTLANRPPSRRLTQRNLHSTLMLLDLNDVSSSRLLTTLLKPHGGMKAPIYTDPNAPGYQRLVQWCEEVANRSAASAPQEVRQRTAPLLQRSAGSAAAGNSRETSGKPSARTARGPAKAKRPSIDDPLHQERKPPTDPPSEKSARLAPRDEFDPEIFNRRYLRPAGKP